MSRASALIAAGLACLICWAPSARAATDTVTTAGDSGPGSLRAVVAAAASGDTVTFDASLDGQTVTLTTGAITIDKSLTIMGPGASQLAVDAAHNSRIFALTNGSLSISGLTLANGAAPDDGGAIEQTGTGSLSVSNCTFTANTAGGAGGSADESNLGHGGAIFVSRSSAATSISGSTFTDNAVGGDGGTGFQSGLGSGGAIWDGNPGSLTVTGSTFTANTAGGNGDGGEQSGNGAGGAIQKSGGTSLIVSDSEFTANTAGGTGGSESASGRGHGGAIYVSQPDSTPTSLTIDRSSFTGNAAGGAGGDGTVSGVGEGGAIEYFNEGSVSLSETTFEGNRAGGVGGAGGIDIRYLGVRGSGSGGGGAIFLSKSASSMSVSGSSFVANTAGKTGGSGMLSGRGEGGAIGGVAGLGPVSVAGSTFTDNIAGGQTGLGSGSGAGIGGAINCFCGLSVADSTFAGNSAGGGGASGEGAFGFGGAIRNFNNVDPLIVSGSTFADNTAGGNGGAGNGGAISVFSVSPRVASITDSTLVGNKAGGGGGVGQGGAVEVDGKVSATLASVTIDGNSVGQGGAGAGIVVTAGTSPHEATVAAKATIVSGNTGASNCDVPVASSRYSLEGPSSSDTSCGFDLPSADPQLQPLADNGGPTETQALVASSPAVDAVPAGSCPTSVDQRGEPRPDNGKSVCDVGAYELQDPPFPPQITSAAAATFQVGKAASLTITATGLPRPALSETGVLPSGLTLADNGDGTARLSGTPAAGSGGTYPITIKAVNGISPDSEQAFTLTVQAPPTASIALPADAATYTQGQVVGTSFACAEGPGGPGLTSCVDQDGRRAGTPLDTATVGRHTFTVSATSNDGLSGRASVTYTVVQGSGSGTAPIPARLRITSLRGNVLRAGLRVSVGGVVARQAEGAVRVTATAYVHGQHGRRVTATRRAPIVDGRWSSRFALSWVRHHPRALLVVAARFAGSPRVEEGSASRRARLVGRVHHRNRAHHRHA